MTHEIRMTGSSVEDNWPTKADREWARRNGWEWNGDSFTPIPFVQVRYSAKPPAGWVVQSHIGPLQPEAPWGSARAALRVAEAFRRGQRLGPSEMSCAE